MSEDQRNIEKVIRAWVTRPTSTSARMARARVLARLAEKQPRFGWRLVTAALLIALAAGGLYVLKLYVLKLYVLELYIPKLEDPDDPPPMVIAERPTPGLLVYELRSGTKLYMALAAPSVSEPSPESPSSIPSAND